MKTILFAIVAAALSLFSAETPDQLRDKGFEALKAAQADETKIVDAARFLAQAAEAYEKAGNDDAASELSSYLFWCKKKMTITQVDSFLANGNGVAKAAVAKMQASEKKEVKPEDAAIWLAKADGFAATSKDPFLSAIRYFEVADRFMGSQESLIAQRKSLDLMGKAAPVQVVGFLPVGSWEFKRTEAGKTYIRIFHANHTFTTRDYPVPGWDAGTWMVKDGKVMCRNSAKIEFSMDVLDVNTMTTSVGGGIFRRIR